MLDAASDRQGDAASDGHGQVKRARALWDAGQPAYGTVIAIPSSFVTELIVAAGFDWICIDCQHGLITDRDVVSILQAAGSMTTFVRVAWNRPELIMRALDAGADGIIVPMVNSAAEAKAAADACHYPPAGFRSYGPTRAAVKVGDFTPASANSRVICAVMIETLEAAEHADEILGPGGLEAPGETARDVELIQSVLKSSLENSVIPGISVATPEQARYWRDAGFTMVAVLSDYRMLASSAQTILDATRETSGEPPAPV
jgi:4-hydroxy-2-oxoheptanedioate aldolase